MQAILFGLAMPVIPLLIWKGRNKEKKLTGMEAALRYAVYVLLVTLLSSGVMVILCDEGISFWEKVDKSVFFLLKYAAAEALAAFFVAGAEWLYTSKRVMLRVDWQEYRDVWLIRFVRTRIFPIGIYLLAIGVIVLNVRLMFDNVVWGDEAFSMNTAEKSVDGILQVMYFWDNHPPLHYYWLKLFGELFGYTVPVGHLASLVPFIGGILLAVTAVRKRFGNIPAAFFVVLSGLASSSVEYNLEVRMYSLAFFGLAAAFYCAYRVLCGGRPAWVFMVLWALVAAYSHYYALAAAGILLFITGVAVWVRYRGKTWIKSLAALLAFIIGYIPWMSYLFTATGNVSNNWWMTDLLGLNDSVRMIMGANMSGILLPLFAVLLLLMLLTESCIFKIKRQEEKTVIEIHTPSVKGWSDHTYGAAVGALTILGTLLFAYLLCAVMGPVLAQRYLYPLSAIAFITVVIESSYLLIWLKKLGEKLKTARLSAAGKCALAAALAVLLIVGLQGYRSYSGGVASEEARTADLLTTIGEPQEDVKMVSNGVQHLGWTVLYHYYPNNEIVNGSYSSTDADKFWYFSPGYLSDEDMQALVNSGYSVSGYGEKQLAKYPFVLYYMERLPAAEPAVN